MSFFRKIFFATVMIGGLVLLYFLYNKYFLHVNSQDIILAEELEEHKRKPTDPGGIVVPNSNSLIYEKLNPSNVVEDSINFLSDPEQPIDLGFKDNLENVAVYDSIDDILAKIDLAGEAPIAHNSYLNEENKAIISDSLNSVSGNETNDSSGNDNSNSLIKNIDQTDVPRFKIIKLTEENNKLYIYNTKSVESGYKIQLSSAWSEKEAQTEWHKIQMRNIKYLKNAQLVVKKVKVNNGRIIYLIMAGNYSTLNQAKLICNKLISSKQNCIVTK